MGSQTRARPDDTLRLVERFQDGDEMAFAEIYRRHIDRVNAYVRAALREESDVQDVAQRVFEAVFEALPGYRVSSARFENWLLRIVRNQVIDHVRKNRRASPCEPDELSRRVELHERQEGGRAHAWGSADWVHCLLLELPPAQQQVLVLFYRVGLTGAEIADVLGLQPEHVRQLRHRALRTLERRLSEAGSG